MPSDKPSHNWKPEWNIDLFATRLQSSHPAHTLVIVNKQLHTGIDLALFSIHCNSWSQIKIYLIVQVSRWNARRVVGFGLQLHLKEVFLQIFERSSRKQKMKQYLITWDNYFTKTLVSVHVLLLPRGHGLCWWLGVVSINIFHPKLST